VDRSTKTNRKAVARKLIEKWQTEIERDEFAIQTESTFLSAAVNYLKHNGQARPVHRLIEHFGQSIQPPETSRHLPKCESIPGPWARQRTRKPWPV
jgi:hypothetical protein